VELHAQLHGKLGVRSKVSLAGKHDLSLAYTPGGGAEERGVGIDRYGLREKTS
jgi:malic enzyme